MGERLIALAFVIAVIVILCIAATFAILFALYSATKIRSIRAGLDDDDLIKQLRSKYLNVDEKELAALGDANMDESVNNAELSAAAQSGSQTCGLQSSLPQICVNGIQLSEKYAQNLDSPEPVEPVSEEPAPEEGDEETENSPEPVEPVSEEPAPEEGDEETENSPASAESVSEEPAPEEGDEENENSPAPVESVSEEPAPEEGDEETENSPAPVESVSEEPALEKDAARKGKERVLPLTEEEKEAVREKLEKKRKRDRISRIVTDVIFIVLMVIVVVVSCIAISFRAQGGQFYLGDTAYIIIRTDSMSYKSKSNPHYSKLPDDQIAPLSLIGIKKVEADEIELYDIIAYTYEDTTYVHRVVGIKTVNGQKVFTAMGDTNNGSFTFETSLKIEDIRGVYTGYNNFELGAILFYLQSNLGIISLVFALLFLLAADLCDGLIDRHVMARIDYLAGFAQPEEADEEAEDSPEPAEPVSEEPAPKEAEDSPEPVEPVSDEPVSDEPAPEETDEEAEDSPEPVEPVSDEPAPEETDEETELLPELAEPVSDEPAPEETDEETENSPESAEPVSEEPAPEETDEEAELLPEPVEPVSDEPAPEETDEEAEDSPESAEPVSEEPAPEETDEEAEDSPELAEPVSDEPAPEEAKDDEKQG